MINLGVQVTPTGVGAQRAQRRALNSLSGAEIPSVARLRRGPLLATLDLSL
jgi:hypothetical protein